MNNIVKGVVIAMGIIVSVSLALALFTIIANGFIPSATMDKLTRDEHMQIYENYFECLQLQLDGCKANYEFSILNATKGR